jgi:hypothetical protein
MAFDPCGEGARPRAPRTGLHHRHNRTLYRVCLGLRERWIARTRSLPRSTQRFAPSLGSAIFGTAKLNPRFLAVWIKRFNRFSSIKVKAASSPPLA